MELTPELKAAMEEFKGKFGEYPPLEQLNGESTEGLLANIQKCLDADKDLLDSIYGWVYDGSKVY